MMAEPSDPDDNSAILWMSNGTGLGSQGDIVLKINVSGEVRYCIPCAWSSATPVGTTIPPEYAENYKYTEGLQPINY